MLTPDSIQYALSRHIPDMERGFLIATNYGEVIVPCGPVANAITTLVKQLLEQERAIAQQATT